jgi:hypothetical protein
MRREVLIFQTEFVKQWAPKTWGGCRFYFMRLSVSKRCCIESELLPRSGVVLQRRHELPPQPLLKKD